MLWTRELEDGTWAVSVAGGHSTRVDADDLALATAGPWHLRSGYAARTVYVLSRAEARATGKPRGKAIYLHRLIAKPSEGLSVDHINGDVLDNRRINLRVLTQAENMQNRAAKGWGASEYRGVSWNTARSKWLASANVDGRRHDIGFFDVEIDAARAAQAFRREHMPFAAREQVI